MPHGFRESIEKAGFPKGNRIKLKWAKLPSGQIFKVDRKRKALVINEEHRRKLMRALGGEAGLEVMLALLFHGLREHFGDRSTAKLQKLEEMMNQSIWAVLR
jgi:hypothetical protein